MDRIGRSKKADLVQSAKLPFAQKLAMSAAASRSGASNFQLIPANSPLDAEALDSAMAVSEKGVPFSVVTLEHFIALKLRAWRYKDKLHINHLLESGVALDQARLSPILERHQLVQRWNQLLTERTEIP